MSKLTIVRASMSIQIGFRLCLLMSLAFYFALLGDNEEFFLLINQASHFNDEIVFSLLSELGNAAISLSFAVFFLQFKPELCKRFLFILVSTSIVVYCLKNALYMERPFAVLGEAVSVIGKPLTNKSFPSGHTAAAFSVLAFIGFNSKKYQTLIVLVFLAALAGVARVKVGAHWPADIIAGAAIGTSFAAYSKFVVTSSFSAQTNQIVLITMSLILGGYLVQLDTAFRDVIVIKVFFYLMAAFNLLLAGYQIKKLISDKKVFKEESL